LLHARRALQDAAVRVTVRCFAQVRQALGADRLELEVGAGTTVAALKQLLTARAPELGSQRFAVAVNQAYAAPETPLCDGDEVAFIPPISGGMPSPEAAPFRFWLQREPIDRRALEADVRTDQDGAVVTFAGVTRDHNEGQAVLGLAYEAYPEMAQRVVDALLVEAARAFPITRARVVHRLGPVPIGEASVVIVVAAPHRGAAFEACRFLIDRLKAQAPIFKQERLGGGGGERWVGDLPEGQPRV
jgi:molybdopterin synthase catalytic subunit